MKFKYRQEIPKAMKEAMEKEQRVKEERIKKQNEITLKAMHQKYCVNCHEPYDERYSIGVCRRCFKLIPKYPKRKENESNKNN